MNKKEFAELDSRVSEKGEIISFLLFLLSIEYNLLLPSGFQVKAQKTT